MKKINVAAILFFLCVLCLSVYAVQKRVTVAFERRAEPREGAFTLLVPRGWIMEGGAFRILDERFGGALNMTECKFDMAVKSDRQGSIMIRWMPEMLCIDQAQAFGNPEGAIFNNALVRRKRDPLRFLIEVAIPYAHPGARQVTVIDSKYLPNLASKYQAAVPREMQMFTNMAYYAGMVTVAYQENGRWYMERLVTVIEDFGQGGGGLWKNRESILIRAPKGELPAMEGVLSVIQNSGKWNMKWIAGEIQGQMKRQKTVAMTQQDIQRMDREIAEGKRKTQAAIQHDMYLTLTGQNDYRNPFTGEVERDTSDWKHRWINQAGDVIYSDDPNYDPNADPALKKTGFRRSQGR